MPNMARHHISLRKKYLQSEKLAGFKDSVGDHDFSTDNAAFNNINDNTG